MSRATGTPVPDNMWDRSDRIAWLLTRPEHRRLWATSPYFRLSVSQLVDHIIPTLIRGAQVTRTALYAEDLAEDAAAALVDGFADQAAEEDRRHESFMRTLAAGPLLQGPHRSQVPNSEPIHHKVGGRVVTRHPSDC